MTEQDQIEEQLRILQAKKDAERIKREQLLVDLNRKRELHESRIVWAKQQILLARARNDPFGYADGQYRSLEDVSDSDAELWLAAYDKQH